MKNSRNIKILFFLISVIVLGITIKLNTINLSQEVSTVLNFSENHSAQSNETGSSFNEDESFINNLNTDALIYSNDVDFRSVCLHKKILKKSFAIISPPPEK